VLVETLHVASGDQNGVSELAVMSSEIMEVVQLFDGLNRYRFRTNVDLRAAWESARNIVAAPRPANGSTEAKKAAA
jgi:hypothetical protein